MLDGGSIRSRRESLKSPRRRATADQGGVGLHDTSLTDIIVCVDSQVDGYGLHDHLRRGQRVDRAETGDGSLRLSDLSPVSTPARS
jgi:hypothetical protein